MTRSDSIVKEFLVRLGAEQPPKAGPMTTRPLTADEAKELCLRLRTVAKKNTPIIWVLVLGVLGLAVAGLIVTAIAGGGTLGLASGGFTSLFILPISRFLYKTWQEKCRIEVFLELFPALSACEQHRGLTRFLYRDSADS
jgi:hypothetical protein